MLNTRQKVLLHYMRTIGSCSRIRLAKTMFLMGREGVLPGNFKFYGFVPSKFGPYSFELFHDIDWMIEKGMVFANDVNVSFVAGDEAISDELSDAVYGFFERFDSFNDGALVDHVYDKYPEYTILSKRPKCIYSRDRVGAFTTGYEGLSVDEFLTMLLGEKTQVLADVRERPWSMKYGFTRSTLERLCTNVGIEYISIPALGIPGEFRKELNSWQDYKELFDRFRPVIESKKDELSRLCSITEHKRVAIMCFERDPDYCHRKIVGEAISGLGAEVDIR